MRYARFAAIVIALLVTLLLFASSGFFRSQAHSSSKASPASEKRASELSGERRNSLIGAAGATPIVSKETFQAPVATDNQFTLHQTGVVSFLGDDTGDFGPYVKSYLTPQQHSFIGGTSNPLYHLIYCQPSYYVGTDSFVYQICDLTNTSECDSATVTLFYVGDGQDLGVAACNANVGGPVNVTNGNMYLQQTDYRLPGVGPMIDVTRTYNSMSGSVGLFGKGWSSAYDESIESYDAHLARFNQADGRAIYLGSPVTSSGALTAVEGDFHGQLTQSGGNFILTMKDGNVHQFNSAGRLNLLTDLNGNQTTLAYDTNGHLTSVTDAFGRVLTFTPDSNGRVLSISDTIGAVATYSYDSGNKLLSVTYADASSFTFAYDSGARLTTVTDALDNVVESHSYDESGRALTSERADGVEHYDLEYVSSTETDVTDALSHVSKYTFDTSKGRNVVTQVEGLCSCGGGSGSQIQTWTYDNKLNVTAKTDALGHTVSYTYDADGNCLTETDVIGTATYTYNQLGEVLTATDKMSGVTTNTYSTAGDLLTINDALNHTTTLTYDSRGQVQTLTDARGKVTTFTWDTSGRLSQLKDALNQDTDFAYDARARLTSVTNSLSETTSYEYDAAGRPNKTTFPDSNFVGYTYDLAGRRETATDARGHDTNYAYDAAYRLTGVTDALSHTTSYGYDLMSNKTSMTDALSQVTNYEYDDFNRLKKIIYPAAATGATRLQQTIEYFATGTVKKKTDTAGRETAYLYDNANRLTTITDPAAKVTELEYNARSQTTGVSDALNQHYTFAYDALGRTTGMTRASVSMSYGYDAVGNRTSRTDYNAATTSYAYDDLNRLTTVTYPNSTSASYDYDALSRITSATNENGTVTVSYDNRGRIAATTDVFDQLLEYAYDENGNRTALALNETAYAGYAYDTVNRLISLGDPGTAFPVAGFTYDEINRLTERNVGDGGFNRYAGTNSTYEYDGLSRLKHLQHTGHYAVGPHNYSTTFSNVDYGYDSASRIVSQSENVDSSSQAYAYDVVSRLTAGTHTDGVVDGVVPPPNGHPASESYSFDDVGNRTAAGGVSATSYTYASFNRLTSTNEASYSRDNNGNTTAKTVSSATTGYAWDFENRLKEVTIPGGPTVSYKYDALGRRIQRSTSNGDLLNFVYDGQDVVQDLDGDSNVVRSYLNGPGIDNKIRQTDDTNGNLYYVTDHQGSTLALTDLRGNVVEGIGYDSFGNSTGSALTRYTYTSREFDTDTGLYYYRARWYDPQVGRFIGEDPIGFRGGDINLYGYVWQNPLNHRDPLGLDGWGNDTADWLDGQIDTAHKLWGYSESEWFANGVNKSIGDVAHGFADMFRVGGGSGHAIYDGDDNGYGRAAGVAMDIARGAAIFNLLGGQATRFRGSIGAAEPEVCTVPRIKQGSSGGPTAGKPFPPDVRAQALLEDPSQTCVFCGGQGSELDHAIPRANNGNATLDNAQWACRHCNASKGSGTFPKTPPAGYRGPWPPPWWKP